MLVEHQHLGDEPLAVKPIRDRKRAQTRHDQPQGIDGFTLVQRGESDGAGSEQGDGDPDEDLKRLGQGS